VETPLLSAMKGQEAFHPTSEGDAARRPRRRPHRPVRRIGRRRLVQGQPDDLRHLLLRKFRNARRPRLVAQQAVHPRLDVALLPAPDRRLGEPGPPHDLGSAVPVAGQQHDCRPLRMLLPAVAVGDDRCQSRTIGRRDEKSKIPSHRKTIPEIVDQGILMVLTIH
jgi:hypothetical protein